MTAINWSNVSSISDFLSTANTNSGGMFWVTMLFTFSLIMFLALINFGVEAALLSTLFVGFILSLLLYNIGLVGFMFVGIYIGGLLFAIIFLIFNSNRNQMS